MTNLWFYQQGCTVQYVQKGEYTPPPTQGGGDIGQCHWEGGYEEGNEIMGKI